MRHTWANAFILLLAASSLVTGYYALVAGEPSQAWQVSAHNVAGFGVVAVLVWKLPNILRPLRRRFGAYTYQDYLALAALTLLLTDILLGIAWVHLGRFSYLGTSGLTLHTVLVFLIVPMVVWHVARYRKLLRPRYWAERRSVLRLGRAGARGRGALADRRASRQCHGRREGQALHRLVCPPATSRATPSPRRRG